MTEKLNEDQVEKIAELFIKSGNNWFEYSKEFYRRVQNIAYQLGFFALSDYERLGGSDKLSEESFRLLYDKIWNYVVEGYIAPGKDLMGNCWFPHCHLTEKGKEYKEKLDTEEKKEI